MVMSKQLRSYAIPQLLMKNQLGQFSISPDTLHHYTGQRLSLPALNAHASVERFSEARVSSCHVLCLVYLVWNEYPAPFLDLCVHLNTKLAT